MDTANGSAVAYIDELLSMIFAHLDEPSLARAACVCKHWSDLALNALWADVSDLKRVLSVLAPLASKPDRVSASAARLPGAYAFRRTLVPADWQRFQRYSGRVRRLRHEQRHFRSVIDKSRRHLPLHPKVFDDLLKICPPGEIIFPNLQSVTWHACSPERQPLSLVFIHQSVKHLGLHLYPSDPPLVTDFLRQVCARAPNLTSLELRLEEPMHQLEPDVLVLLQGLHHLQRVSVPIYCLTSRLLTELSHLQRLVKISLGDPARAEPGSRADVANFTPAIGDNAFPALRSLSFSSQVADATQLLRTSFFPAQLTELHFKCIVTATPVALHDLFSAIRDRCTSLVELSVDYIIAPDSPLISPPPPVHERPSLATFRPLFSACSLHTFELRWDYALSLHDDDMDEFARSWPSLESLQLNSEPVPEENGPTLTLRALLPFATHCPALRHLGLHIDARVVPSLPPPHHPHHTPAVPRFAHLHTLAIGLSAITKAEAVTLFLSQLLPLGCSVLCGLRWPDAFDIAMEHALIPVGVRAEMSACWVRWNDVARLLPVATKARMEEKARFDALERQMRALEMDRCEDRRRLSWLEREVEDLRVRTGRTP